MRICRAKLIVWERYVRLFVRFTMITLLAVFQPFRAKNNNRKVSRWWVLFCDLTTFRFNSIPNIRHAMAFNGIHVAAGFFSARPLDTSAFRLSWRRYMMKRTRSHEWKDFDRTASDEPLIRWWISKPPPGHGFVIQFGLFRNRKLWDCANIY